MERAFRLAGLLRLRALQEDQAAAGLAAAHGALSLAEAQRRSVVASLAGHAMPAAADAGTWQAAVTGRAALAYGLADAAAAVHHAGERVGEHTAVWSAARSRTAGLEKLQDAHRTAVAVEDARAEQHALDEVASRSSRTSVTDQAVPAGADRTGRTAAGRSVTLRTPCAALPLGPQEPPA